MFWIGSGIALLVLLMALRRRGGRSGGSKMRGMS